MAHIRDPENNKKPADVEERRMAIYRDLFFNNVDGFVSSAYPVLKSLYTEQAWQRLIRHFFSMHDCKSRSNCVPNVYQICRLKFMVHSLVRACQA